MRRTFLTSSSNPLLISLMSAIALLLSSSNGATAEDAGAPASGSARVLQQYGLEVTLLYEGRMVLGESIVVIGSISNAGQNNVTIQHMELTGSGVLSRVYTGVCKMNFGDQTIKPKESLTSTCTLTAGSVPPSSYLYKQEKYHLLTNVKVASLSAPIPVLSEVKMAMPELSVVTGALVGVVLLVLFTSSYAYLKVLPKIPRDLQEIKSGTKNYIVRLPFRIGLWLIEVVLRAMQGGIVALILIVFTRTTTELGAPIMVRVDDFWGGLLVGIFSVPLSVWLAEKLGVKADQQAALATNDSSIEVPK